MPVQSMTGFARHEGQCDRLAWVWELRSVNGKGLDIRLRLPSGMEDIDAKARTAFSKYFKRGNIQVSLQLTQSTTEAKPKVNEALAIELWEAAKSLQEKTGGELPSVAQLMSMKGVVEFSDESLDETTRVTLNSAILKSLERALEDLSASRLKEGGSICEVLISQVSAIDALREKIVSSDARTAEAISINLQSQIDKLLAASEELDPQRIHQEAVILAAKADLQEELDRLEVHLKTAKELLSGDGPIGRKLDFLAQEFNRECNTICSKSNSAEVTSIGLDIKLLIDQFREQVQNME